VNRPARKEPVSTRRREGEAGVTAPMIGDAGSARA